MVQAYKGRFKRMESGVWIPDRENKHKGTLITGKVSDIRVFDNGKLVDEIPGGYNTISSGASFDLLAYAFFPYSAGQNTVVEAYRDVNNFYFPNLYSFLQGTVSASTTLSLFNMFQFLFGSLWGIKGWASGLASHQSVLNAATTQAWGLGWSTGSSDWFNANLASAWQTGGTISQTSSNTMYAGNGQNGNVPGASWNISITSLSTAQTYTVDSLAWLPKIASSPANYFSCTTSSLASQTTVTNWASGTTTPTAPNNPAVSALYALPYSITVNPNGVLQFTYTFQGA